MLQIAPGWQLSVERGPAWLIVHLSCTSENAWDSPPLAETLWSLLEQHFSNRLVIECHELPLLHTMLIGQLLMLQKRIAVSGGMLRLCGLSPTNQEVLETCRLHHRFPSFDSRAAAVMGREPVKPR